MRRCGTPVGLPSASCNWPLHCLGAASPQGLKRRPAWGNRQRTFYRIFDASFVSVFIHAAFRARAMPIPMARRVRRTPRAAPRRGGVVCTSAVGPAECQIFSRISLPLAPSVFINVESRTRATPIPLARRVHRAPPLYRRLPLAVFLYTYADIRTQALPIPLARRARWRVPRVYLMLSVECARGTVAGPWGRPVPRRTS